eukprot:TRINITY_DN1132_c0_g1_i2.p1 TRINITY_DN1132_c0_g1~~TRINITY_DN1132_c0_g1_i2.p1  ORF type:complete len:116 (+),score=28.59 TRINITY_DN1132_c0_g1_i2:545-892(+)
MLINKELRDENEDILRFLQTTSVYFNNRMENPDMMFMPPGIPGAAETSAQIGNPPHYPPAGQYQESSSHHGMNAPYTPQAAHLSSAMFSEPTNPPVELPPPASSSFPIEAKVEPQ